MPLSTDVLSATPGKTVLSLCDLAHTTSLISNDTMPDENSTGPSTHNPRIPAKYTTKGATATAAFSTSQTSYLIEQSPPSGMATRFSTACQWPELYGAITLPLPTSPTDRPCGRGHSCTPESHEYHQRAERGICGTYLTGIPSAH